MAKRIRSTNLKPQEQKTFADRCAEIIGSWPFIGFQAIGLTLWICLNTLTLSRPDPYPFILLNLLLSTQAAFATPLLLLSANRQSSVDRDRDIAHYNLDLEEKEKLEEVYMHIKDLEKKIEGVDIGEHF